jgi:hypothetical protein
MTSTKLKGDSQLILRSLGQFLLTNTNFSKNVDCNYILNL